MSAQTHILIIDDDAVTQALLKGILTTAGYGVSIVDNGYMALSSSIANPPDLILSDIRMPGIDGYELCRRLKMREETRHIPVILISAISDPGEWAEGLRLGAVDFISKPIQAEEVRVRIATHLELSRAHAEITRDADALSRANEQLREEITERKRTEKALRESEERYGRITKGIMDYLYSVRVENGDAVETRHGATCVAVTGYTAEDFAAFPFLWIDMVPVEEREEVRDRVKEILTGKAIPPIEHRIIRKDGEMRWVSDTPILHNDALGKLLSYDGVVKDITERKRAEEEILRQREELSHITRVATVSELATTLAHEINQPLAAILSNAQAALRFLKAEKPDLDEVRDALIDIVSDDRRAGAVIKELRAFVKKEEPRWEPLDITNLVGELLVLTRSDAVIRNIAVTSVLAPDLPRVRGNRIQLQQVILNLIMNGCEAMDSVNSTGGVMGIQAFVEKSGELAVEIADHGQGLIAGMEKKIFEPLFTTKPNGLGMGLAISRTIIEAHGGTLTARNNPDRGATFRFTLPAERQRP